MNKTNVLETSSIFSYKDKTKYFPFFRSGGKENVPGTQK